MCLQSIVTLWHDFAVLILKQYQSKLVYYSCFTRLPNQTNVSETVTLQTIGYVLAQFKSENGENLESPIDLPRNVNTENLQLILNALLKKDGSNELIPYTFFVNGKEVVNNLEETLQNETLNSEKVLEIIYQPQAIFQVRAVTRCTRYYRFIGNDALVV